jgi:hypothetical protein
MKRNLSLLAFVLSLISLAAFAQTSTMDSAKEKNVQITQGPTVTNITGTSATINWTTDKKAANHVKYRVANEAWKSAYTAGGSTNHSAQLTGLQPGQTVDWQILTQDGDVRTSGQFQTASTATGTAPDVNASSAAGNTGTPGATGTKVPLYRFVSTNSDAHTYSTSTSAPSGFRQEGTAGYVMQSQVPGTVPLYSLTNGSDSMLSTNPSEGGYQNSGIVGYIATSQQPGTVPLYRMVNTKDGKHFATADTQEHSQVLGSGGFRDDGTLGYIWQQ